MLRFYFIVSLCLAFVFNSEAQKIASDSLRHSPKKAGIYSAIIPGLGQYYNKKNWKIPIIYAGLGTCSYFIITNAKNYSTFNKAYNASLTNNTTVSIDGIDLNTADLFQYREYYRRNLDVSIIACLGVYAINIIDAVVDAHLFEFNVNDNLKAVWIPDPLNKGISMQWQWNKN